MKKNNGRIDVEWGGGVSDLFLELGGYSRNPQILDCEYDSEELHERCGGITYYTSCSGNSGAGWLKNLGSLIPLGSYRVDTVHNDFQLFLPVGTTEEGEEILVAVPYRSHEREKIRTLLNYPTVVKVGNKVVYCDFKSNFKDILRAVFSGKELPEECEVDGVIYDHRVHRTLRRTFTDVDSWAEPREEEIAMEFYNLCSMSDTPDPWEFLQEELRGYETRGSEERMFQLLSVEKLPDGTFVRTMKIDGKRYRGKILEKNPLDTQDLAAGWDCKEFDALVSVLVRFYDRSNEAHLVAYALAAQAYEKQARRLANLMGEGEKFISFASDCGNEYVEYELVVPKALYLLEYTAQVAELRKGLAKKIRADVTDRARQWIENMSDQTILEAAPDDLVIEFEDSLAAGNCRPGTEKFVKKFFPGQTQTTAAELKKFADNRDVMRIFRHLAATGRYSCKDNAAAV